MKIILVTAFLVLVHCIIHAQSPVPTNSAVKSDSFLHYIYIDTLPGAAIAIMQNNKVVFEKSYGVSNIKSKAKISVATNFNIASLTKQFTAMAILQLAEQKKLSLNDKLSRFFPDMNKSAANAITIQHLLTHTSGIVDHYAYTNTTHLKHAHNKDVYNAIKNLDSFYFLPGTQFRYSNTGFCLLALVIEKAGGMSYNRYMEDHIFKPAGMLHTTIWSEAQTILQPATGYEWDSAQNRFVTSGADEHVFFSTEGDGGIYTSVCEYLHWLKALNEEKIFSKAIVEKARSIEYSIDKIQQSGYGFGWFVDENNTVKKVYHSGSNGGFRTYSFTIPQEGYSIVIFSNRADIDVEEIVQQINNLLYPNSKPFVHIEVLTS